ncbi:MAG: glycerophosphodiester phosphodiesterase family protein [Desulforhopalus sp.]
MGVPYWLENRLQRSCDWFYTKYPQTLPSIQRLEECKIVSHRGEHDNKHVYENTVPAFERLADRGVWGIEFDIRWTRDLVPVVFHDSDCKRLFDSDICIREITAKELRAHLPLIPFLKEVIQRFGKKFHFMVELKTETYPDPVYQNQILQNLFAELEPKADYHFISLNPEMFQFVQFVPNDTFLPVAELNVKQMSAISLQKGYGGVTGHYLMITNEIVHKQHRAGKQTGTGFISSRNCLCRELNRGIEWIFTNNAVELQVIHKKLLADVATR